MSYQQHQPMNQYRQWQVLAQFTKSYTTPAIFLFNSLFLFGVTIFSRVNPTLRYGMASQAALSTHFQGRTAAKSPASMHLLHFKL